MINSIRKKIKKIHMLVKYRNLHNVVFNHDIDSILQNVGSTARKLLESTPQQERKRIVYFLGYHHSKFSAIIDAINILALQIRGAEVYTIRSSFSYEKEDMIFGGLYNKNRFENQYNLSKDEGQLLCVLLQAKTLALDSFLHTEDLLFAQQFAAESSPKAWRPIHFMDMPIGEMAFYAVANLNNQPYMSDNFEHHTQFKEHLKNAIIVAIASKRLLETVRPSSIVSNVPFYYPWRIPYEHAMRMSIPYYSYMLAEKKNSIFWTHNTIKHYDTSQCWHSLKASDVLSTKLDIVHQGVKDRSHGAISNHKFAPDSRYSSPRLERILKKIDEKPTILFPCNVLTDAAVFSSTPAFESCLNMIKAVISWFAGHPEYYCILKAHPAEKLWVFENIGHCLVHLRELLIEMKISLPDNVIFIRGFNFKVQHPLFDC